MITKILKQIWAERKSNGWLFIELILVASFLWYVTDRFMVDFYTYHQPKGFDVSHTYRIKLSKMDEADASYRPKEILQTTDTDDLLTLMQRMKQIEGIETSSVSFYSCFYSNGNANRELLPDNGNVYDPDKISYYNYRRVTPEFFDMFQVRAEDGKRIDPSTLHYTSVVISKDLKEKLFPDKPAIGQAVYSTFREDTVRYVISSVSTPVRNTEYERADPCFFACMVGPSLAKNVEEFGVTRCELFIRVNPNSDKDFTNFFTRQMGERMTVNNVYISGIEPIADMRANRLNKYWKDQKIFISLISFVLLNVFFGIIATFWLRTGYRKGEMGLRVALGSTRKKIISLLFTEGLCLLVFTVLPVIIITLNIAFLDYTDTYRLPFSVGRFILGIGITYLLLFIMIALGIWYPARRSAEVQPAEALHYE